MEAPETPKEVPALATQLEGNVSSPEGKGDWTMRDRPVGGEYPRTDLKSLLS